MGIENHDDRVIVAGVRLGVEWAVNARGKYPARPIFESLPDKDQAALLALFERLANHSQFQSDDRFKRIEKALYEFKRGQIRFFGDFRHRRFLIAHGVTDKKSNRLRRTDIDKAHKILRENDEVEKKGPKQ